jgi:hypothetical protein
LAKERLKEEKGKDEILCSLDHLESLVRRREVIIEGLEQLVWAHMFMEGARKLGASFLVSCLAEGALLD